jgi:predicted nucleic-acid-binding Zn-ribbon protein
MIINLKDEEIAEIIIQKLKEKWVEPRLCPICHSNDWIVEGKLAQFSYYNSTVYMEKRTPFRYVVIPIICKNCNYTLLFNAATMDILENIPEGREL